MPPKIRSIDSYDRGIIVNWDSGESNEYPYIWLRDNDTAELHPSTLERIFDLTTVAIDIVPDDVRSTDTELIIRWPDRTDDSSYMNAWLYRHRPGVCRPDPAKIAQKLWNRQNLQSIPRFSAEKCIGSRSILSRALLSAKETGLIIFDGLGDNPISGESFADLIGFKRQTNFGVMFEVESKRDPNNLAYTAAALPLHIDLTNQEHVPGYQFLHCVNNSAVGGDSVFADGYQICADLQQQQPAMFERLKEIDIPCRFHDRECDIRQRRPVISQDKNGEFTQLVFNAHLADVPDMPSTQLFAFYEAYQALMALARQEQYSVRYQLQPGEMVMFDNRRVMHGRSEFDPATGDRLLRGYYIDRGEVDSRIRVLRRQPA